MAKKQFKAESKRLLDLMVNSHLHPQGDLSPGADLQRQRRGGQAGPTSPSPTRDVDVKRKDLKITIVPDKEKRLLTVSDNGIGMTKEELEANLGTIAHSGSGQFKAGLAEDDKAAGKIDVIGQFGVGFYSPPSWWPTTSPSSSRAYGSERGLDVAVRTGPTATPSPPVRRRPPGTDIIMHIKANADEEKLRPVSGDL